MSQASSHYQQIQISDKISRPWRYRRLGMHNCVVGAALHLVGCLAASPDSSSDASGILRPVVVSRHCHMSPGGQNHPQWRATGLTRPFLITDLMAFNRFRDRDVGRDRSEGEGTTGWSVWVDVQLHTCWLHDLGRWFSSSETRLQNNTCEQVVPRLHSFPHSCAPVLLFT